MPNKRVDPDHNRKRQPPRRPDLTAAVLLLRQTLAPHATVDWSQPDHDHAGTVVIVRGAGAAGGTQHLWLLPWTAPARRTGPTRHERTELPVVWVLPRAPAALRETLRARGEQYIDLRGAVHLALPWVLVDRTDLTPMQRSAGALRPFVDPFADRSSLVLRAMLEQRDAKRAWGVRELASAAGVGVATASDVLRALAERHLVSITRHGRAAEVRLLDPAAAVEAWPRAYDWRLNHGVAVHVPAGDLTRFMHRLLRFMPSSLRWSSARCSPSSMAPSDGSVIRLRLVRSPHSSAMQAHWGTSDRLRTFARS